MASAKRIAIAYEIYVKPLATNLTKPARIHSWWYEAIPSIDSAQRNSDSPGAYIALVNISSQ
jgi:hypothetical protein